MRRRIPPLFLCLFFLSILCVLIVGHGLSHKPTVKQKQEPKQLIDKREETVQKILKQMTIEEKVGQLFWGRLPEANQIEDIQNYHLGGYILFGKDFEGLDVAGVKELTTAFQKASRIPLLIGSDEEGGTVTRISAILEEPFLSPMDLYQTGGIEAIVSDSHQKAQLLKSVGINAGLFPVADVATDSNAFIYDRTIGQDASTTAEYVSQVVTALEEEQFGSTLKHFPGYGNNGDSHTNIIEDNRSVESLRSEDFLPFQAGIKAGADSILVSHNILTQVDDVPSSISPKLTNILREELSFDGVILTDDFDMAGLADFVSQDEAAFQALQAGNDMILGSSYSTQIPYLLEKVASGQVSEQRIDESVKRILYWKYDLGLLNN